MKDIFNIIGHEQHDLKIVNFKCSKQVGCVNCGETLYTQIEVSEIVSLYDFLVEEGSNFENLKSTTKIFLRELIESNLPEATKLSLTDVKEALRNTNSDSKTIHAKATLLKNLSNLSMMNVNTLEEIINKVDISLDDNFTILKNKIISDLYEKFLITTKDPIIVSNTVFELEKRYGDMLFVPKNWAMEKENENPTIKEVKVIASKNDYDYFRPDWEDEENEDDNYKKFIFMHQQGLLDLQFEDADFKLVDMAIDYLADYEYVDRYVIPARLALKRIKNNKPSLNDKVKKFIEGSIEDLSNITNLGEESLQENKDLVKELINLIK